MNDDTAPDDVSAVMREALRLGLNVDLWMSRWRNKYPAEAVDGVLVKVPAGTGVTLNGRRPHAAQAYVLREAIKAIDVEPAEPEWEYYAELDSWTRPIVAPN
ncbi:hypothetical protein [Cellulosimicrobium aquatile]|uniref:hypothetical protein n=1 Tax=Cellulosimicrobium aquatile TaxID=1612203 RepID=UPI0014596EF2|nr:hypothetical protein [Cellulosimicrobium aquatile]NMF28885.1 hypothetical protein [Cellulosimicrobium aquatile]